MARWPSYNGVPSGGPLLSRYALPSVSKNNDGSMPSTPGSQLSVDHGPAALVALAMKLPPLSTAVPTT